MRFWPFDLGDIAAIAQLVPAIRKEFGPLYGLVNNAATGTSGVLASMRVGDIESTIRLNTVSPLVLTKAFLRARMADGAGKGGHIVTIASIIASTGFSGLSAYAATKAAAVGFTKSLAREVGSLGITVNAVAPGIVDTTMTEDLDDRQREQIARRSALHRLAEIAEVAEAVAFLCQATRRATSPARC